MDFSWLLQGIVIGLFLSVLVGPILFALIQAGIERGFRAGLAVGLGIWMSDFLFIFFVYNGLQYVQQIVEWTYFEVTLGIVGGIILCAFGIGTIITQRRRLPKKLKKFHEKKPIRKFRTYLKLWSKGFLINTFNPFTFFFWLGLMGTVMLQREPSTGEISSYFGGIMMTVITIDLAKVFLAKKIRNWLQPKHVRWVRLVSGAALLLFGLVIFVRFLILN